MNTPTLIVGGGIAGLRLAQALVEQGHRASDITLLHTARTGESGSTNPGALLNPVPGASLNPKQGSLQAFGHTLEWMRSFPEALRSKCRDDLKLLRPFNLDIQPGRRLLKSYRKSAATISKFVGVRHLDAGELAAIYPHLQGCDGAIEFSSAATLPMAEVCVHLTQLVRKSGVNVASAWIEKLEPNAGGWRASGQDFSVDVGRVVLAAGSQLANFFPNLPLRATAGHLATVSMPNDFPTSHAVSGRGHLCPMADGTWVLGATYHQENAAEPETQAALQEILLSKMGRWIPATHQATWLSRWRGVRAVVTPEKQPLVGPVPNTPGLFVLGAFASRGLQWAPYCGSQLANYLLGEKLLLPAGLEATRYSEQTWALREGHQTSPNWVSK